jgi:hypothetical protein
MSTRYWAVGITSVAITIDERGTVYRCGLVNKNAEAGGIDSDIPTTMKMKGNTVKDILTNLLQEVENQKKKSNDADGSKYFNSYKIEFLPMKDPDGKVIENPTIAKAEITEFLRSNRIFEFALPTDNTPKNNYKFVNGSKTELEAIKYDPTGQTVSIRAGAKIQEVIEVVIRDSDYVTDFIKNKEKYKAAYGGLLPWYRVFIKTKVKDLVNPQEKRPNYTLTFEVRPYWVHFSRLPEEFGSWDPEGLKKQLSRSYNYIYTGKNVDLLEFRMNFNQLYYSQRPFKLGDQDRSATTLAAAPASTVKVKAPEQTKTDPETQRNVPKAIAGGTNVAPVYGMAGKPIQMTPYVALAQAIQSQLLDTAEMAGMQCKIIGDPFYLVTSGAGNSEAERLSSSQNTNGEATWLDGDIYVSVDFQNPRDYLPDGYMDFGGAVVDQFSGIFMVRGAHHHFADGEFTQTLEMTRLPGQQPNKKGATSVPLIQTMKPGESPTKDSAPSGVKKYGANKSVSDLNKLLNPKIPSFGLPGLIGGITGLANSGFNALQSSVKRIDAAVNEGLGLISGIVTPLEQVALAAAQIGGIVQIADALLSGQDNNQIGQSISGYNPYTSGVPLQTNTIPGPSNTAQNQANQAAQANIISSFVQDQNNLYTLETNYANNVITADGKNYITNPSDPSNLNNVGQNISAVLNGTPSDPFAIASQLGIDPQQFAGLSADQQTSLIGQLQKIFAKVPTDANIQGFQALGLSLKNLTGAGIANLPALQALTTAPLANISQYDLQKIIASGGNIANLPGAAGLASIGALLALLNSKPSGGSSGGNPLNVQQQIDKFSSAAVLNLASLNTPGVDPATQGLGSIESNQSNAITTVQGFGGYYVETTSVNSLYGTQRSLSPLDKLMLTKQT